MQPNLEIRERVAREVMGQTVGRVKLDPSADQDDDYAPYVNDATGQPLRGLMYHEGMLVVGSARLPAYEVDIAAAWKVHKTMCAMPFSRRQRYFRALADVINNRVERPADVRLGWPDLFMFMEPIDICLAALRALAELKLE